MTYFKPLRERKVELASDPTKLREYRELGTHKAHTVASVTIQTVKIACGLS
jgi:hypothetical protein